MEPLGGMARGSAGAVEDLLSEVGPRVRGERLARGMTLEELAERSGVSTAHLSRLESGDRQPSLAALLGVAAGLGVPVSALLEEPGERGPGTVVRGAEAPFYEGEGFRFQPLVPEAGPEGLAAVRLVFPADRTDPEHRRHEGEEWLYVLKGRLRLTLGGESTVLGPGDAAYFDAMLPHAFDVLGGEDAEVLCVACAHGDRYRDRARGSRRGGERLHPMREGHGAGPPGS